MFNRTDGMQHATKLRTEDGARSTSADTTPRIDSRNTPSAGKAEDIVELLANRMRRNETRR